MPQVNRGHAAGADPGPAPRREEVVGHRVGEREQGVMRPVCRWGERAG